MPITPESNLSQAHLLPLTQAMLTVAHVDGIQPAEAALIGQFYEGARTPDMPSTAAVLSGTPSFDARALAGCPPEVAETVVLMGLMTGHADGHLSPAEHATVQRMARELGVDDARFEALLAQVRDDLIGALSHLPDAVSVAQVVRELAD